MRLHEKLKLVVSEDVSSDPKKIRFSEEIELIDIESVSEVVTRQEVFPAGSHSISLGNIAAGKVLVIRPTSSLSVSLDNETIQLTGGKAAVLWTSFSSLELNTVTDQEVLIFVGG